MKNLSKNNIFKTPEGYFDSLPDRVLEKYEKRKTRTLSFFQMTAAAAVFLIGLFFFVIKNEIPLDQSIEANLEQEIDLYINSGHWGAEDILSFSDNPNVILDEIIKEEWGTIENDTQGYEMEEWW
jgi:hypothetical protein